jgi:hypothetical protein
MTVCKTAGLALAISWLLSALGAATPMASLAEAASCAEFPNQAAAQEAANTRDGDGDGIYCEDLPCPCSQTWHEQHDPPSSEGSPLPPDACAKASPPGSLRKRVWLLRDRCGVHRGLLHVPRGMLGRARHFIGRVRTALRGPASGYSRSEFGSAWTDSAINIVWAGNGCDTRNDILRRDLTNVRFRPDTNDCVVEVGRLRNPYLGTTMSFSKSDAAAVPIDHVFPLSLAWQMGARKWSEERRIQIANDPLNLLAVDPQATAARETPGPLSGCRRTTGFAAPMPFASLKSRASTSCRSPGPTSARCCASADAHASGR